MKGLLGPALLGHLEAVDGRGRRGGGAGGVHQDGGDAAAVEGAAVDRRQQDEARSGVHGVGEGNEHSDAHGGGEPGQGAEDDPREGAQKGRQQIGERERGHDAVDDVIDHGLPPYRTQRTPSAGSLMPRNTTKVRYITAVNPRATRISTFQLGSVLMMWEKQSTNRKQEMVKPM